MPSPVMWDRRTPPPEAVTGIPLPEGGFRLRPYFDGFSRWSIGAGSTTMPDGSPVTARSRPISLPEARALLAAKLAPCCRALAAGTQALLTTGQAAGLLSWEYNCGAGSLAASPIPAMLAASRFDLAVRHLAVWCEAHDPVTHVLTLELGLMRRRQMEALLWTGMAAEPAYLQAWQLTPLQGHALRARALADAAAWAARGAPADTTDALNDASAAGSLPGATS